MRHAIKKHYLDFIEILVLILLAVVVTGYVLSHERLSLPFISPSTFTINAALPRNRAGSSGSPASAVSGTSYALEPIVTGREVRRPRRGQRQLRERGKHPV